MKKLFIITAILLVGLVGKAQEGESRVLNKKGDTPLRNLNYVEKLKPTTNHKSEKIENAFLTRIKDKPRAISTCGYNNWCTTALLQIAEDKAKAKVVVGGTYTLNKENVVEEKLLKEKSSSFGVKIPYKEIRITNKVNLEVVHAFTYPDGKVTTDTIVESAESMLKPGKELKSLDELTEKVEKAYASELYSYFVFIATEKYYYKFMKLKIKDKALKEEYKTASKLMNNGDIKELGKLFIKLNEASPSNEASHCIGMCYELLGNFPKAQEYYKKMPDFPTKTRMKKQMAAHDYLLELGFEITYEDFE